MWRLVAVPRSFVPRITIAGGGVPRSSTQLTSNSRGGAGIVTFPSSHHQQQQQQYQQHLLKMGHLPFLFALATVATFTNRPIMALAESTATTTTSSGTSSGQSAKNATKSYIRRLLPQDIYYDTKVQEALQSIRNTKRVDYYDDPSDTGSATTPGGVIPPILAKSGTTSMATLTLIGYKGGPLDSQINQDRAFCLEGFLDSGTTTTTHNKLLGVFDGHAKYGEKVSQYTVDEVAPRLEHKLRVAMGISTPQGDNVGEEEEEDPATMMSSSSGEGGANPQEFALQDDGIIDALTETFIELDRTAPAHLGGGCTATVVLQWSNKLYVANAGDSQSFVVMYRSRTASTEILYKTREDKPHLPDERARVEAMGGTVYIPLRHPGGTSRVLYEDPVTGHQSGLAMSRSIGDWDAGRLGVIPDPIVEVIDLDTVLAERLGGPSSSSSWSIGGSSSSSSQDEDNVDDDDIYIFAVSATDGMMDYVDANTIAGALAESLYGPNGSHPLTACEKLITMAANGWQRAKQGRYRDDIAIAVSTIREPKKKKSSSSATTTNNDEL